MTQNKTINSQIEEMKKGCGTDFSSGNMPICICGAKEDKYTKLYGKYCPSCQAKLSTLQECQKMFLEEIKLLNIEVNRKLWFKLNSTNCANIVIETYEELKSKIGGEDDTK